MITKYTLAAIAGNGKRWIPIKDFDTYEQAHDAADLIHDAAEALDSPIYCSVFMPGETLNKTSDRDWIDA